MKHRRVWVEGIDSPQNFVWPHPDGCRAMETWCDVCGCCDHCVHPCDCKACSCHEVGYVELSELRGCVLEDET